MEQEEQKGRRERFKRGLLKMGKECRLWLGRTWWKILVGFLLIVVIIFGIAQPFIWRWKWGESPPAGAIDLSVLLTIILALLALFAGLVYWNLRSRIGESLGKEIRQEIKAGLARAIGMTAYTAWRAWRSDTKNRELLEQASRMQRYALEELVEKMGEAELQKVAEILPEGRIYQQKGNLAGYVAYKGLHFRAYVDDEEITLARKFGKQAYEKALELDDGYDWQASYAGVLAVFGTTMEKEKAKQIMQGIKGRVTPTEWQEYCELFDEPI